MVYLNGKLLEEKVFKDLVYCYVYVWDKLIWDLIGICEFQCFCRIKQFGMMYLMFYGVEYSWFNYFFGVYEIVRRMVDDVFKGCFEWDDSECEFCLVVVLFYDFGYGLFLYLFEKVFYFDYEDFIRGIILGDMEVNQVFRKVSLCFLQDVVEVIVKIYKNK